jgi:GNAT superfamily N-acetyltransferase
MSTDLVRELEEAVVQSWPAAEQLPLDGWLLRASGGPTHRGNSVATLAALGALSLSERLLRVERWYRQRGQLAQLQVGPCAAPPELDAALEQRGYRREGEALVMTASAVRVSQLAGSAVLARVEACPGPAWRGIAAATSRFASSPEVLEGFLARLAGRSWGVTAWLDVPAGAPPEQGRAAAMGLGIAWGRWLGVYAMHTAPALRRRGAARALLQGLAAHALSLGTAHMYLLVEPGNVAARALYAQCGFEDLYPYHYRIQPQPG